MTTQAPPAATLPNSPDFPAATVIPPLLDPDIVNIESTGAQTYHAGIYTLDQNVVITYRDDRVSADHIVYDRTTGELTLTGNVLVIRAENDERIHASHGTYNLKTLTGRFYDVSGSVGVAVHTAPGHAVYTNGNPMLFTGRIVVKTGPHNYDIYDGTLTSCQLPDPDWILTANHFNINEDEQKARGYNSTFHLLHIPLFFLPYVTHPTNPDQRESGILIPTIGESSTKGIIIGEQIYVVLNRSADITIGSDYYSSIGWAEMGTLRLRGPNIDFATLHYSGVLDRRVGTANQGGEEVVFAARHDFNFQDPNVHTRAATNIDYLSSYTYREAFSDTFNQAVTSDIVSTVYLSQTQNGTELAGLVDKYQGIKLIAEGTTPQQQVRIFHAPTLSYDTTDHRINGTATSFSTGLELDVDAAVSGLKRSDPNLVTGGIIERYDLHPQVTYPIFVGTGAGAWHILPTVGARETVYSRSRLATVTGQPPQESLAALSRSDFEFSLAVRPPVFERTFKPSPRFQHIFGTEIRHTIAPELTYRLVDGVSNFASILRFDPVDVVSNTDEAEYGVTQRLYRRPNRSNDKPGAPCSTDQVANSPGFNSVVDSGNEPAVDTSDAQSEALSGNDCPNEEFISWRLTQKFFFDETFGKAIQNGRRNIFTTTLDLSGVAFLTEPREISPLISRLRVRSSAHTDVEWDFDYDTGAKKFTSSNVYVDLHQGLKFAALSYARLDAPGRFYTESPTPLANGTTGVTNSISDFNQLRFLLGYGNPAKPGLSLAGNAGIDLKALYGATSVNSSFRLQCIRRCYSTLRCRPRTTGTAAGWRLSIASWSWGRCAMKGPTGSASRWPISGRRGTCAAPNGSSNRLTG
jgi:LPS-assembly protein